jgi:hypothetical protein
MPWIRETVRRHSEHGATMRRPREEHIRWLAGVATGGVAVMVGTWNDRVHARRATMPESMQED